MLEKLLNPEVGKNVVKQVAIPANKRTDGYQVRTYESIIKPDCLVYLPVLFPILEKSHQMLMKKSDWGESQVSAIICIS
jgi:hypothetical protein